jgi:hypothetical protein
MDVGSWLRRLGLGQYGMGEFGSLLTAKRLRAAAVRFYS